MKGWIVNTARRNLWRVYGWYDLDDLIQDGFICYCMCLERYSHVKEKRHLMALVKVTYINHIHRLARKKRKRPEILVPADSPVFDGLVPEDASFITLLGQLPEELRQLIDILLKDACKLPRLVGVDGVRETTNQYLCRLVGLDATVVDLLSVFREHLA